MNTKELRAKIIALKELRKRLKTACESVKTLTRMKTDGALTIGITLTGLDHIQVPIGPAIEIMQQGVDLLRAGNRATSEEINVDYEELPLEDEE